MEGLADGHGCQRAGCASWKARDPEGYQTSVCNYLGREKVGHRTEYGNVALSGFCFGQET